MSVGRRRLVRRPFETVGSVRRDSGGFRVDPVVWQSATLMTFSVATYEYRGGNGERTEYHACVAWDRLAEICGQFLSKGHSFDIERPSSYSPVGR